MIKSIQAGQTLPNGNIVITCCHGKDKEKLILLEVNPRTGEYVTHIAINGETYLGHYTFDFQDAVKDYNERR